MPLPIAGLLLSLFWVLPSESTTFAYGTPPSQVNDVVNTSINKKDMRLRLRLQASLSVQRVPTTADIFRQRIVTLTNAERAKAGLKPMKENAFLHLAAQAHAKDMFSRKFFSHQNPDGLDSSMRIKAAGYVVAPCTCNWRWSSGENIARNHKTPESAFKSWMQSPKHKANILSTSFDEIGIGYSNKYWVQNFGNIDP